MYYTCDNADFHPRTDWKMKNKYTFRKLINDLHLWIGIPSALVLFVICLTGTIYVFRLDIGHLLDQDKIALHHTDTSFLPIEKMQSLVEKETKGKINNIQIPANKGEAWTFVVSVPEKNKGIKKDKVKAEKKEGEKKEKTVSYFVDPYSGKVMANAETPAVIFFATVLKIHRWFLLEKNIGGVITGTAALMMIFLQISGFILWFPAKIKSWKKSTSWKPGFKIKTDGSFKRVNFDLHKALGFYSFLFVTIMAVTGPYFAFDWYKKSFAESMGVKKLQPDASDMKSDTSHRVALEKIIAASSALYPYSGNLRLNMPSDAAGTVTILKSKMGFFDCAAIDRAHFDQYSGKLIRLESYADKKLGEKIVSSIKFIHTGELFGTFSKILYFIACLIATSLPITGVLIWWGKRNKEPKKAKSPRTKVKVAVSQA